MSDSRSTLEVPCLDLHRERVELGIDVKAAVDYVIESGQFVGGPFVRTLEEAMERRVQKHVVTCGNGTDALEIAISVAKRKAGLPDGVPGNVVVPAFTFYATASAVHACSLKPLYADCVPTRGDFRVDPAHVAELMDEGTVAVIAVSIFGQACDFAALRRVVDAHNARTKRSVQLIEDAAQSFGGECSIRSWHVDVATTSFYPSKPLGAYGDGGAMFFSKRDDAREARALANHGVADGDETGIGRNSRLDGVQAAVLLAKLPHMPRLVGERKRAADRYNDLLAPLRDAGRVVLPTLGDGCVVSQYTVEVANPEHRDPMVACLREHGVDARVFYPKPCYAHAGEARGQEPLPHCESKCRAVLSLPLFPFITAREQQHVVQCVELFWPTY